MREQAIRFLSYLIKKLSIGKYEEEKTINSLAPKILMEEDDLQRISPYTSRLNAAIKTKGINNIALTGIHGSGKSTILQTFQYHLYRLEYKYLNISLATFNESKESGKTLEKQLEISILQQIFYQVKPSKIPDSRFNRIINLTPLKIFFLSSILVLWFSSIFILFKFGYIDNLNLSTWSFNKAICLTTLASSIIFFIGLGYICKVIIRFLTNSKINKLNIKGEVELINHNDKSVFNEHLEEIIYFFQRTKKNVVIIEDLDRFANTNIFTRLRELNILLNNSELIQQDCKSSA